MADYTLSEVDIVAVSLCKGPANRKRFFLKKCENEEDLITSPARHSLIKNGEGDDWSVVYAIVAEPGWEEGAGVGDGAEPGTTDVWASPEEIMRAAHRFMKNGGLINRMHEDLMPYGTLVENFIAPADMEVNGEQIKAGSWCIGIEPTDEGRKAIDAGEWDGVSYQGDGFRTPVEKQDPAKPADYGKCDNCGSRVKRGSAKCPNCGHTVTLKKAISAEAVSQAHGPVMNLVQHYMKKKHPFTACVRDNTKRFGKERAEAVCARLKDIGHGGQTGWRKGGGKLSKSDLPFELVDQATRNWLEAGLTADDATMALKQAMADDDRTLLQKIADKLGISVEGEAGILGEEEEMTDEQKAQLEKVGSLEDQLSDLTAEDGRLAKLESGLQQVLERLPEKQEDPEAEREQLEKQQADLAKQMEELDAKLDRIAEGDSRQDREADDLKKKDDPDAALAHALFG